MGTRLASQPSIGTTSLFDPDTDVLQTEIAKFAFRVACPELYRDYIEVQNALPESQRWITTLDDPFTLRALLVNLSTEDHTDDCDWTYGIAALVTMGEYEGKNLRRCSILQQ